MWWCEDWVVALEEAEFERVGLGGWARGFIRGLAAAADIEDVAGCEAMSGGAEMAVGVGVGVTCAEETVETEGEGWWFGWLGVGMWPV